MKANLCGKLNKPAYIRMCILELSKLSKLSKQCMDSIMIISKENMAKNQDYIQRY